MFFIVFVNEHYSVWDCLAVNGGELNGYMLFTKFVIFQSANKPFEVLRATILLKACVILRKAETRGTDSCDKDKLTLTTIAAVCRHWCKTIKTCNDRNRRQLCRTFHCEYPAFYKIIERVMYACKHHKNPHTSIVNYSHLNTIQDKSTSTIQYTHYPIIN